MSSTAENSTTESQKTSQDPVVASDGDDIIEVPLSDVGNSSKPPLPKSKSKVTKNASWTWSHFQKINGKTSADRRAICNYCSKNLSCPSFNGTSCLSNHLLRCKKYPANSHFDKTQKTLTIKPSDSFGGTTHQVLNWKFSQEDSRRHLATLIIRRDISFRFVEYDEFRDFCYSLNPNFNVPSRHTIGRDCYAMFKEEKMKMMKYLKSLNSRVCLTTDAWTSIQNLNYMCVTCHFIDDDWTLHKKVISFCPVAGHSGEVIGMTLEKCLLDWGLKNIFTVTVDNASSNDLGIQYLKGRLNSWGGSVMQGNYLHMRCAAHILSLIVKDGMREIDNSIVRIRHAVKYVRSSPSRLSKFKECAEKELLDTNSLVCLDVETRWNSTYLMLQSAVKFQKAFVLLECDRKYRSDMLSKKGLPEDSDWEFAKSLLPFLECFYETTLNLSGSLYVTGNEYMRHIYGLGLMISSWSDSDKSNLVDMAAKMKAKFDKYWANINNVNIMLFVAVVLDPRCKLESVDVIIDKSYDENNAKLFKEKLRYVLYSMYEQYSASLVSSVERQAIVPVQSEISVVKPKAGTDFFEQFLRNKN